MTAEELKAELTSKVPQLQFNLQRAKDALATSEAHLQSQLGAIEACDVLIRAQKTDETP